MVSNRNLLFQGVIFRFHVSVREGNSIFTPEGNGGWLVERSDRPIQRLRGSWFQKPIFRWKTGCSTSKELNYTLGVDPAQDSSGK